MVHLYSLLFLCQSKKYIHFNKNKIKRLKIGNRKTCEVFFLVLYSSNKNLLIKTASRIIKA